MNHQIFDVDGTLIYSKEYDTEAGTVTIFDDGQTATTAADPAIIASLLASAQIDAHWQRLDAAATTFRGWAADADATTVTTGNAVAVLQVVVDRLGIFFDRFADLLDERG